VRDRRRGDGLAQYQDAAIVSREVVRQAKGG